MTVGRAGAAPERLQAVQLNDHHHRSLISLQAELGIKGGAVPKGAVSENLGGIVMVQTALIGAENQSHIPQKELRERIT
jgi:hypothetical protein